MGTVPSAKGYLVSRFYVAVFKDNVKFLYDSGYIFILKGFSFIVRQSIKIQLSLMLCSICSLKLSFPLHNSFYFVQN